MKMEALQRDYRRSWVKAEPGKGEELKHLQKLLAGLVGKGQRVVELMFGLFEETALVGDD